MALLEWPGLDHPVVATTSGDRTARVWDPRDPGRELARFDGHFSTVYSAAGLEWPGLDHPVVVTTSHDGTARVWDPRDPGRELARFDGHGGSVWGVVASPEWPGLAIRWSSPPRTTGRRGCGIRATRAGSWPASTATAARCLRWRRWSGRAWTTR